MKGGSKICGGEMERGSPSVGWWFLVGKAREGWNFSGHGKGGVG